MKLRYVGSAPFFSSLSEEEQERISERMHLEHRHSGEVLFTKGDDSTALYLVKSGWVRLVADGGTVLASQGPGSLVGETDVFLERPRSFGATVATDAELWILSSKDLLDLIARTPQTGIRLALAFGSRLPLVDHYLVDHRLRPLPFLSGLRDDALAALARRLTAVEKQAGEFIVEERQSPEALFIVESGQVHLHSTEEGGDFSELGAGDTFGEMAVLTGKPHAHSVQAATEAVLWALPVAGFEALAEEHPQIRLALSKSIREPLPARDVNQAGERLCQMPLFSGLADEVLWAVAERMLLRHVPAGELVFAEDTPGDALYLIDTGQIEIVSQARPGGKVLAHLAAEQFFGEMALLTGKPRSTAARAATHSNLWVLYRADFEDLVNRYPSISLALSRVLSERLADMDRRFAESHLRSVKLLAGLSSSQLEDVSRRLRPARFHQGETVVREGAPGDEMFFIESGRVRVERGTGRDAIMLAELGAGDLFGEMALLTGNPRCASVTALSEVDLWVLPQADFEDLVSTYPNLALSLSRLLSERLRTTDERYLRQPVAAAEPVPQPRAAAEAVRRDDTRTVRVPAAPRVEPVPVPRPKPAPRRARARTTRALRTELREGFDGAALWFRSLSRGARVRLVLLSVLLVWLVGIAVPAMLISTLAAADVTNFQGAIAFVQRDAPLVAEPLALQATPVPVAAAAKEAVEAEIGVLAEGAVAESAQLAEAALQVLALEAGPADAGEAAQAVAPEAQAVKLAAEEPSGGEATATPWVIVVTNTPLPPTDTPIPPTETPVPPTATPKPVVAAAAPLAPRATATPARQPQPPRDLDPRLGALNVQIAEAQGLQPGQSYFRLIRAYWHNKEESGNDHTIYVDVLDENGSRMVGQPVLIQWQEGSLTILIEDKPVPEYGGNFPMFGTLGSYSASVQGAPSDTIVGMGMGTPEQPAFTIHTNFLLTFQRVRY